MQQLIIIICRDQIDSKQVNLYVRQIFETYHINKIKDYDLYKVIFLDLFELNKNIKTYLSRQHKTLSILFVILKIIDYLAENETIRVRRSCIKQ